MPSPSPDDRAALRRLCEAETPDALWAACDAIEPGYWGQLRPYPKLRAGVLGLLDEIRALEDERDQLRFQLETAACDYDRDAGEFRCLVCGARGAGENWWAGVKHAPGCLVPQPPRQEARDG